MKQLTSGYKRILAEFGIKADTKSKILKQSQLTEDSHAALIYIKWEKSHVFLCLYSEDFIPTLDHVKKKIEKFSEFPIKQIFTPVKSVKFKDTTNSAHYNENYVKKNILKLDEWAKYAVEEGSEYAFLAEMIPTKADLDWAKKTTLV